MLINQCCWSSEQFLRENRKTYKFPWLFIYIDSSSVNLCWSYSLFFCWCPSLPTKKIMIQSMAQWDFTAMLTSRFQQHLRTSHCPVFSTTVSLPDSYASRLSLWLQIFTFLLHRLTTASYNTVIHCFCPFSDWNFSIMSYEIVHYQLFSGKKVTSWYDQKGQSMLKLHWYRTFPKAQKSFK